MSGIIKRDMFFNGTIYHDFLNACNIDWDDNYQFFSDEINRSLSRKAVKICRVTNAMSHDKELSYQFNCLLKDVLNEMKEED